MPPFPVHIGAFRGRSAIGNHRGARVHRRCFVCVRGSCIRPSQRIPAGYTCFQRLTEWNPGNAHRRRTAGTRLYGNHEFVVGRRIPDVAARANHGGPLRPASRGCTLVGSPASSGGRDHAGLWHSRPGRHDAFPSHTATCRGGHSRARLWGMPRHPYNRERSAAVRSGHPRGPEFPSWMHTVCVPSRTLARRGNATISVVARRRQRDCPNHRGARRAGDCVHSTSRPSRTCRGISARGNGQRNVPTTGRAFV